MTSLIEIATECNKIAEANGFDRPTWENFVNKIAFAITELDEGRDGALGFAEDPLSEELADTAIRLLSVLDAVWAFEWHDRVTNRTRKQINRFASIETLLWPTLGYLCKAIEAHRYDDRVKAESCVGLAVLEVWRLADAFEIDLMSEVLNKCEKNRGRGHLHGKAHAAG